MTDSSQTYPRRFGALASLGCVALSVGFLRLFPQVHPVVAWLFGVNLTALIFVGYDKSVAGGTRTRVPERVLLVLSFLGGSVATFVGMRVFRHKVSKRQFQVKFWVAVTLQITLVSVWYLWLINSPD